MNENENVAARETRHATTIDQITRAFDGVSRGIGVTLHEAQVLNAHGSDKRRAAARRLDTETRWQDVPPADIGQYYSTLCYLDPEGFRYYTPAFIVWTLRNLDSSDAMTIDWTIYAFCLTGTQRDDERRQQTWSQFNIEQRQTIAAFLRFMAEDGNELSDDFAAQEALRFYWDQFAAPQANEDNAR